jgi:hypothetical protein
MVSNWYYKKIPEFLGRFKLFPGLSFSERNKEIYFVVP